MLTDTALQSMRNHLKNAIAYAMYKVGESYYRAEIQDASLLADGRIAITFIIDHTIAGNVTVTEVQPNGNTVQADCFEAGVLLRNSGDTLVLSPPLIISKAQIGEVCGAIRQALADLK